MRFGYEVFGRDVEAIVGFYVDVLGFTAEDGDQPGYRVVRRGGLSVGCCHSEGADAAPRRPPVGSEVVLKVDDVLAEHRRVVDAGWPLADPLQERPWGLTDFRVLDPTGQYLRVSSATPSGRAGDGR